VIYEVRILKSLDSSWNRESVVTLIEYRKAKDILDALSIAESLAKTLKGSLKAVTASPETILLEDEEDSNPYEYKADDDSLDEFTADKEGQRKIVEKKK